MISKINFSWSFVVTFITWIFDTIMFWTFMVLQSALMCSFIVTFITLVFFTIMWCSFMSYKIIFSWSFIVTFITWIFDTIMYRSFMIIKSASFCLVATLIALVFYTLMYWYFISNATFVWTYESTFIKLMRVCKYNTFKFIKMTFLKMISQNLYITNNQKTSSAK